MDHNMGLLHKQEKNSRKALLCLAGKSQERLRNRSDKSSIA